MFAASLFRRPASRAQAMTEVVLAALLALQPVLWVWALDGPAQGRTEAAALTVNAHRGVNAPPGDDPFFKSSGDGPVLTPHTLYAVRSGAQAGAIVAGPDGVHKAVRVGEIVSEGVVLAAVASDHVVLAHGRARTRLDFPAAPPAPGPGPAPAAMAATGQVAAGQSGAGSGGAETATYATALRPVSDNGADGYVWRPGTDGGVLAAAGLRPGDVIVRINGTPFDRAERMEELAADIAAGHAVDLEYRRNGAVFSSRYTPQ
ncbi:PDZ domain-containing protein [Brevundimonas sp.]|uniref:PDZ domain-containing protein n=1 Tax=Brevundimonas sp. TaxID=1871086 RepID=UPI003918DA31